ncbi:hypothetical protein C8039_04655 [Halogeometricum sp. wsp3]|nr:hypothetical protein C8039_04655 [Halogeometricum sp. wsp3]
MKVAELRALDVPVVLFELMVQRVRVREVRVQRVDNLLGLLLVESEFVLFDIPELASDVLCVAIVILLYRWKPLKDCFVKICFREPKNYILRWKGWLPELKYYPLITTVALSRALHLR